ncbi:MAG: DsbA family oxidoreductase [Rhodanobacteraceae bacterium]|nr:MAG: DsbA family oxidoreductase [Rhodanobacteraceae bacterium]
MATPTHLRIDFVSDVACPWCAVGLAGLQQALATLDGQIEADIHLQPFELEPDMPAAGQDAREHIMRKYGINAAQSDANRNALRARAAAVGFDYNVRDGSRVWNTFDAHRLLHWAETQDGSKALLLKQALFRAYFTDNENVADREVLVRAAAASGLDADAARRTLESNAYAEEVRTQERRYQQAGVHAVPATIVNGQYLIAGGQPPEAFVNALREIAAKTPVH